MKTRLCVAVLLTVSQMGAARAQALPPVSMTPASPGGVLPPAYQSRAMPAASEAAPAPVQQPFGAVQAQPARTLMLPGQATAPAQNPVQAQQAAQAQSQVQVQAPTNMSGQQQTAQGGQMPVQAETPRQHEAAMNDTLTKVLEGLMPANSSQLRQARSAADDRSRTIERPGTTPMGGTRSISLTLRPGEELPLLHTFMNNVTTLTFSDGTGAPWPVQAITIANPDAFKVDQQGIPGSSNILVISPRKQFTYSNNMVVTLVGNPVPVIFMLETGGSKVDFRVDVGLRGRGPNAAALPMGGGQAAARLAPVNDSNMRAFVDATPPSGARHMTTCRADVEVWRLKDLMYVRTPLDLRSPQFIGFATHLTGVKVFSLVYAPVLILSQNGSQVRVDVSDRPEREFCR